MPGQRRSARLAVVAMLTMLAAAAFLDQATDTSDLELDRFGRGPVWVVSWNVNSIRRLFKEEHHELEQLLATCPSDVLCFQEIRVHAARIPHDSLAHHRYFEYWYPAETKGYAGTAIFSKWEAIRVIRGLGLPQADREGRCLTIELPAFYVVNCTTPVS